MVIFAGSQVSKLSPYLFSSTPAGVGIVTQAADHLIQSTFSEETGERTGKVTFSWYKLDNTSSEVLTDVLKAASTQAAGGNTGTSGAALVLREAGRGRGMVIPNIVEVEISQGRDIEQVVGQVLQIIPHIADYSNHGSTSTNGGSNSDSSSVHSLTSPTNHNTYTAHTVFQLTVTNTEKLAAHQSKILLNSPSAINADHPGIGRVSFLLLSPLSPGTSHSPSHSTIPPLPTVSCTPIGMVFPWVEQLK